MTLISQEKPDNDDYVPGTLSKIFSLPNVLFAIVFIEVLATNILRMHSFSVLGMVFILIRSMAACSPALLFGIGYNILKKPSPVITTFYTLLSIVLFIGNILNYVKH